MPNVSRRTFLNQFAGAAALSLAGCGVLLYPERRGQKRGRLDWKVVALDGAGLLLFFVPGVIAFAVDIMEGTIYLPPEHYGSKSPDATEFERIAVPPEQMSRNGLATLVSQKTGKTITLDDGQYVTTRLNSMDQFWNEHRRLGTAAPRV